MRIGSSQEHKYSEGQGKLTYYKRPPNAILRDINKSFSNQERMIEIKQMKMICSPHVYPSDRFRTTNFILDTIQPYLNGARICDMGCGLGVIGLYAIAQGARKVVQADINPFAVINAEKNKKYYNIPDKKLEIYQSDCFDNIPVQKFDVIVFNLPFHSDLIKIKDPIEHAFFDPKFQAAKKFLSQSSVYALKRKTLIFLAFSNKGDIKTLEKIFNASTLDWKLWKIINQNQEFDNRIYLMRKCL